MDPVDGAVRKQEKGDDGEQKERQAVLLHLFMCIHASNP